jgi:hypothetical protein
MTLHVYVERNGDRTLVDALEFQTLQALSPVFQAFRKKTGVLLSEYDDAELAPNHSALLTKQIDDHFAGKVPKEIRRFHGELKAASGDGSYIYFLGE